MSIHGFSHMMVHPDAGLLVATHEDGIAFVDTRNCQLIRHQYTKEPVACACTHPADGEHFTFFAGAGCSLVQYETRMLSGGALDSKTKPVGMWTLPSGVLSVDCVQS